MYLNLLYIIIRIVLHVYMHYQQFRFANGEPRARAIKNFSWEKSSFSRKFRNAKTAKDFLEIWHKQISPHLNVATGEYSGPDMPSENVAESYGDSQRKRANPSCNDSVIESKRSKLKDISSSSDDDRNIEECFSGQSLILVD